MTTLTGISAIEAFNFFAASTLNTAAISGLNSLICSSKRLMFEFAAKAQTFMLSFRTTSRVCVPIEPVEPKIERYLFIIIHHFAVLLH